MRTRRGLRAAGLLGLSALTLVQLSAAGTVRVSLADDGTEANHVSAVPAISSSARFVVFQSSATNLVGAGNDGNGFVDIFVRDRDADGDGTLDEAAPASRTIRMSVSTAGAEANGDSARPDISGNGRFVVFSSNATNLVAGDTAACMLPDATPANCADIFVRDRDTDANGVFDEAGGVATVRVSVSSTNTQANGHSDNPPAISSNGRFVLFRSHASNLVPGDTGAPDGGPDFFVRDRDADRDGIFDENPSVEPASVATRVVSVTPAGAISQVAGFRADISGDGRFVAFDGDSPLTSETVDRNNGRGDVLLRDRDTDADGVFDEAGSAATIWVTGNGTDQAGPGGEPADGFIDDGGEQPAISDDGSFVAFVSHAQELVAGDTNVAADVFQWNRETNVTTRASVSTAGAQAAHGAGPLVDVNGGLVAFETFSSLVAADTNFCAPLEDPLSCPDVYVRSAVGGTTNRISIPNPGQPDTQGNAPSLDPAIAAAGCAVAFDSTASNLVAGDMNGPRAGSDVFVWGGDRDGDGLCDDWETNGVDGDGDGTIDLHIENPPYSANPDRKDLFLEIDYMVGGGHTHRPNADAIADVIAQFAGAPVPNPNGTTGVTLHVRVDSAGTDVDESQNIGHDDFLDFNGGGAVADFDDRKATHFGAPGDSAGVKKTRGLVFRYAIFGHSLLENAGNGEDTISESSEIGGNDFIVTLGEWTNDVGTRREQSGTVMHEFGHTLGLHHGGADDVNCKPNYVSVMSYSRQFEQQVDDDALGVIAFSPPLGYSSAALGSLNEGNLGEAAGIGSATQFLYGVNTGAGLRRGPTGAGNATDWNNDGDQADPAVARDVSRIDQFGCGDDNFGGAQDGQTVLTSHNDWASLKYNFRDSADFADGAHFSPHAVPALKFDQITPLPEMVPFASFSPRLELDDDDEFDLKATFTLGAGSNGIAPLTEAVKIGLDAFSLVVPAGSFKLKKGRFTFEGTVGGADVEATIRQLGGANYELKAEAEDADLSGVSNPVLVTLEIGDDGGAAFVTAEPKD